jgi:hypothetical protein
MIDLVFHVRTLWLHGLVSGHGLSLLQPRFSNALGFGQFAGTARLGLRRLDAALWLSPFADHRLPELVSLGRA